MASIERNIGPAQIDHLDRDRVITVEANTQGRALYEILDEWREWTVAKVFRRRPREREAHGMAGAPLPESGD